MRGACLIGLIILCFSCTAQVRTGFEEKIAYANLKGIDSTIQQYYDSLEASKEIPIHMFFGSKNKFNPTYRKAELMDKWLTHQIAKTDSAFYYRDTCLTTEGELLNLGTHLLAILTTHCDTNYYNYYEDATVSVHRLNESYDLVFRREQ
ncbi:MAG: hypothetical protein MRY83_20305, partial [Flavobacteriales bacterium]|nr:hypothetical protein [Flavobacteriales bacterium]